MSFRKIFYTEANKGKITKHWQYFKHSYEYEHLSFEDCFKQKKISSKMSMAILDDPVQFYTDRNCLITIYKKECVADSDADSDDEVPSKRPKFGF